MKNKSTYYTYGCKVEGNPCSRWPYKSINDPKYIKDRDELFKANGNGWWINTGKRVTTHKGNREVRRNT